ncbi:MAG: hypothetical protein ABW024_08015 [Microbacterium sp.]
MTAKHRRTLLIATAVVVVGPGLSLGPLFGSIGFLPGLGVFALAALIPAAVLGITASIWHANDKEARLNALRVDRGQRDPSEGRLER